MRKRGIVLLCLFQSSESYITSTSYTAFLQTDIVPISDTDDLPSHAHAGAPNAPS